MIDIRKLIIICPALVVIMFSACTNQGLENEQNDIAKDYAVVGQKLEENEKEEAIKSEYLMPELQEINDGEYLNVILEATNEKILSVDADLLYSYGNTFAGETVLTAFKVSDTMYDLIRYKAPHNKDDTFMGIVAKFDRRDEMDFVESDEMVAVIGKIKNNNHENGMTVTMEDCKIVAVGVDAHIIKEEIKLKLKEQHEWAKAKGAVEPIIELPIEITENKYRATCKGFQMRKVLKEFEDSVVIGLNKYYEEKAWFYGTIIQRVELSKETKAYIVEYEDECWYVVHTTNDTEELCVGDNISTYGDCIGIKKYKSTQGQEKIVPVMKLKYFEKVIVDGE